MTPSIRNQIREASMALVFRQIQEQIERDRVKKANAVRKVRQRREKQELGLT